MANDEDRWTRLVGKLIADTRSRKIRWTAISVPSATATGGFSSLIAKRVLTSHFANFEEKGFRLDQIEELGASFTRQVSFALSIADAEANRIKQLPASSGLNDLYRAIEDQISQVDEFLDKYLND